MSGGCQFSSCRQTNPERLIWFTPIAIFFVEGKCGAREDWRWLGEPRGRAHEIVLGRSRGRRFDRCGAGAFGALRRHLFARRDQADGRSKDSQERDVMRNYDDEPVLRNIEHSSRLGLHFQKSFREIVEGVDCAPRFVLDFFDNGVSP